MPNIFTPNNDGKNDFMIPVEMRGILSGHLEIYNRWGQKLFTSADLINNGWNGSYKNIRATDGVYYWIVNYFNFLNQHKVREGVIHLMGN